MNEQQWEMEYEDDSDYIIIGPTGKYGIDFVIKLHDESRARRIVACVNACAGIETEVLEKIKVSDVTAGNQRLLDHLNTLSQEIKTERRLSFRDQRDELLAALKEARKELDTLTDGQFQFDRIDAIIAKCEGKS